MALKTHHKVLIGGFSTIVVIYMIVNGFLLYTLFIRLEASSTQQILIERQINDNNQETQAKINDLSSTVTLTKNDLATQIKDLKNTASSDFSGVIEIAIPSVVTIRTDIAQGTGFVISSEGYVVTNAHVLAGGKYSIAITSDQNRQDAELIGYNTDYDIAVLKITPQDSYLPLGNSNDVQVGEKVIAIGNPIGLQFSASEGIISGVDRQVESSPGRYLQTDAALNPGNSGGPLIDKSGLVIGINNFKAGGFESLGFALESNEIRQVVNQITEEKLNKTLL